MFHTPYFFTTKTKNQKKIMMKNFQENYTNESEKSFNNHLHDDLSGQENIQLLNTAIIKSKEKSIDSSYEERLSQICSGPEMKALGIAIKTLAEGQKISHDQAAIMLVEAIRNLDTIWSDYVMMEGIGKLKELLKKNHH